MLGLLIITAVTMRLYIRQPTSGDEPHYLLIADSLIRDGDFDLYNDYTQQRYLNFYPGHIPDPHISFGLRERVAPWYPSHGVGLAALIVLPLAIAGKVGAVLTMIAVAVLVVALAFAFSQKVAANKRTALMAAASLFLSPFFLGLNGYIFPDLLISLLLLVSLVLVFTHPKSSFKYLGLGLIVAASWWIHFKTMLFFGPLSLFILYQIWRESPHKLNSALCFFIPTAISFIAHEIVIYQWYGTLFPWQIYGKSLALFKVNPGISLAGMLLDAGKGLLSNNPLLLLIFPGLIFWARKHRASLLLVLSCSLPALVIQSTFPDWGAGYAPPGRYIMEIVPLYVPAIALVYQKLRHRFLRILAFILVIIQLLLIAGYIAVKPRWTVEYGTSTLFDGIKTMLGFDIGRLFPHVLVDQFATAVDLIQAVIYLGLIVLLMLYVSFFIQTNRESRKEA